MRNEESGKMKKVKIDVLSVLDIEKKGRRETLLNGRIIKGNIKRPETLQATDEALKTFKEDRMK